MTDARLERDYPVSPERLFAAVTHPADLTRWWGPEGTAGRPSAGFQPPRLLVHGQIPPRRAHHENVGPSHKL